MGKSIVKYCYITYKADYQAITIVFYEFTAL